MKNNHSDKISKNPVILFDGVCNLCNASVRFLLNKNRKRNLHFASLQSEFAKETLQKFGKYSSQINTIIFVENGRVHSHSDAVFQITKHLNHPWKNIYYFRFIPRVISDSVYHFIAKNRYHWFGKNTQCLFLEQAYKNRFHE